MTYTIKGLKTWDTHDGGGWQVSLYANGKRIAEVTQRGHGGPLWWEFKPVDAHALVAFGASQGVSDFLDGNFVKFDTDADSALCEMVDDLEHKREMKRWCKTKVVFRFPQDEEGKYRTIKCAHYTESVRRKMVERYGPDVIIMNKVVTTAEEDAIVQSACDRANASGDGMTDDDIQTLTDDLNALNGIAG
tara:strand:+ start:5546 stop:6115 length:570 start_codon:yes stop_codon:yes gene_type:complete